VRPVTVIMALAVFVPCVGCFQTPAPTAREEDRGLVYVFPGINGGPWYLGEAYRAYRDAGVDCAIRIDEWDLPLHDGLGHLQNLKVNRSHAATVAGRLAEYRAEHPDAPICLVGYSAGGGIALLVTEALPTDVQLRNVVLVQSAVSPTYDLTPALQRIDGQLVNLHSPLDWFILGWGTRNFGTVDRAHVASCGKDGFDLDKAVQDETLRARVVQRPWQPEMIWSGHDGGHGGILLHAWNKKYVAPWLPRAGGAPTAGPATGG
jgi:pimeloyl-ACP methyl ester carboxylesterase